MKRPSVKDVSKWEQHENSNPTAKVYVADIDYGFFYKVEAPNKSPKYFYGETAWQDAKRYADDNHTWSYMDSLR